MTMEKEPQPESMATVNIKPEYPPSEVYSSEPPPAYHRPQSSAVQVAKIVAVTVVLVSVVLGSFLLASAYVTANASCRQLEQDLEILSEAADRFQPPPQPEALIQEEPIAEKRQANLGHSEESQKAKEVVDNNIDNEASDSNPETSESNSDSSSESEEEERTPIHFKLPLQLDFDDLAGALIEKNQKSRMNCVVEKKRAEEVVDHQPKTVRLPFGVNLTTDPRYEHLSGERMAIFCESGNIQRAQPQEQEQEDTIMIQPVMIPIPHSNFPTHMAQQMRPMPPQFQAQPPQSQPQPQVMHRFHPMETMRPPMPPMVQIQAHQPPQAQQQSQQPEFPPSSILHHIAQQIIAQKIMESQKANEEQSQESSQSEMNDQRIPLPEEVLTQLNRLPNRDVIVAVSEQDSEGQQDAAQDGPQEVQQEMRVIQEPRQNAQGMNGRQTYARGFVVPVPMMPHQEQQAAASEETRPHYVQPRSVRSVDALLPENRKRVKRCSCDCAC